MANDRRNHIVNHLPFNHCLPISMVVLTYNEENNLSDCLASVVGWTGELLVVDSGSNDRTLEIARQYGAHILSHPFETHARQWNWTLDNLSFRYEWVLGLDADQRVTPELRDEIIELFGREAQNARGEERLEKIDGFYIKRRQVFRGKWIRHGGYYPKYLLKLFRRQRVRIDLHDLMDHHFYVTGRVAKLHNDIIEENENENDISFWIEKHNRYATLIAREELQRGRNDRQASMTPSPIGNPDQRTLWLKRIWHRLPLYLRPFLYFFYRYFFRFGFLDGKEGLIFHFLQGCWFRLLVDIKIDELKRDAQRATSREQGAKREA